MVLNLFFKFRFILVLACLKNYKRHDAKFCSVKCFERVHVLQMSPVHVLQMSPVHVLQMSPVHVLQMSPVHVLQMSPVHVLQMSPVHVLQMSPVHVLQMSPVHVLQMSPVHVLQMSPVQVLQNESSPCFTNESSPGFTSPVQSMFYNMPEKVHHACSYPCPYQLLATFNLISPISHFKVKFGMHLETLALNASAGANSKFSLPNFIIPLRVVGKVHRH